MNVVSSNKNGPERILATGRITVSRTTDRIIKQFPPPTKSLNPYQRKVVGVDRLVYACGPMFGCTYAEASGWRFELKQLLGEQHVLDPVDWAWHPDEAELSDTDCQKLVQSDINQIDRCQALIWNFWKPSVGAAMEAWYARRDRGMLVVVIRNGPCPAWARVVADYVVSSVSEAARIVAEKLDLEGVACRR